MLQILGVKACSKRGVWVRALTVLLAAALGAGVALRQIELPKHRGLGAVKAPAPRSARVDGQVDADRVCFERRAAASGRAQLPLVASNQPELRAQLLGRAKSVPLFFLSRPEPATDNPAARALREELEASPGYHTFGVVVGKVRRDPELAQAVFLREGYLYTEVPELAALYGSLTFSLLFRDPELRIVRGSEELRARRLQDGDYEYTSGSERGHRAKLLLFDRITRADRSFSKPRHVDLRSLSRELGFDELSISSVTDEQLVGFAHYGELRVALLIDVREGQASLGCEAPGAARQELLLRRAAAARAAQAQARLLSVIKEQVDEGLPFDEPKTEDGQQDGKLRPEWRTAYLNGKADFEFNGDRYRVFDDSGRPRPPQVCIDFVLDTFERAAGNWWRPRGEPRGRAPGRLQFDDSGMANRRSVERFIDYARAHGEAFDVYDVPPEARVPFRNRAQFFAALYAGRAQLKQGDIVAILGPREDEKLHYHSFIIVGRDPLSGLPTELAANAGRPRIRSWEGELSNAPRRSLLARIRPKQVWLESFLALEAGVSAEDPSSPLGPGAKRPAAG
jgi:hypothetical protein